MRAATMKERPSFPLMRQTDVQTIYHRAERIVWISDTGAIPQGLALPPKHFFAARQPDGSHRFYGSNGP